MRTSDFAFKQNFSHLVEEEKISHQPYRPEEMKGMM